MKPRDPLVNRIAVVAGGIDRRQQQFGGALHIRLLGPQKQFFVVVARRPVESGHDHHVELQPLGLVNGHDLQAVIGFDICQRVKIAEPLLKHGAIRQFASLFMLIKITEKNFRIFEVGFIVDTGRTAQREPRARHLLTQRRAPALPQAGRQRRTHPRRARTAIFRQKRDALVVMQRIPQRHFNIAPGQHMQIGQCQSAPRRAQHREPRQPVARMCQRTGQHQQILHDRTLAQRLDVDGAEAQVRRLQRRHNLPQMTAGAGEYRHLRRRISGARSENNVRDLLRFGRTVVIEKRMHMDCRSGQRGACRHGGGVRHCAGDHVFRRRQDARKSGIDPFDNARLRPEVG